MREVPAEEAFLEEQKLANKRRITELFANGVDLKEPGNTIAVHATSLEALDEIIKTGKLPTGLGPEVEGEIYFFRLDLSDPQYEQKAGEGESEVEVVEGDLRSYGKILAFEKYAAKRLGLDPKADFQFLSRLKSSIEAFFDKQYFKLMKERKQEPSTEQIESTFETITIEDLIEDCPYYEEEYRRYAEKLGFDNIIQTALEASRRKGIILGFNSNILALNPEPGDGDDDGWQVKVSEGLSLDYLSGIEPLGDIEYAYLEKIQEEVGE